MASLVEKLICTFSIGTALLSSPLAAQERQQEQADEAFSALCGTVEDCTLKGSNKYKEGSMGDAINMFKEALLMNPVPEYRAALHLNLSVCYRDLGEPGLAIDQLLRYLKERPDNSNLPDRSKTDRLLEVLHLYEQGVQVREEERRRELPSGEKHDFTKAIELLEKAYAESPGRGSLGAILRDLGMTYELAGNYKLAAENYEGYLREFSVRAADREALQKRINSLRELKTKIELPTLPTVPPPPERSFFQQHRWSLLAAGGAAALGVGALANHLNANAAYQDLQDRCERNNACSPSDGDGIKTRDTLTAVLGIGSALAAGTAAVLFYLEIPDYAPTPTANGVEWKGRF